MKNSNGIALLAIILMLSGLIGLVAVCVFVMGNEADDDARYDETRERMLEVKRALIGRLADVGGGEDITSCEGFISDYGEPDVLSDFCADNLLSDSGLEEYAYNDTHLFWAGYRGEEYLEANAKDSVGMDTFIDGWGYPIEIIFQDSGDTVLIRSKGCDNKLDDETGADTTYYGKDIEDIFYWRRSVSIKVTNTTAPPAKKLEVLFIYPDRGIAIKADAVEGTQTIPSSQSRMYTFGTTLFPVGLRKILVWDVVNNDTEVTMYCLPPGENAKIVKIDYEG